MGAALLARGATPRNPRAPQALLAPARGAVTLKATATLKLSRPPHGRREGE